MNVTFSAENVEQLKVKLVEFAKSLGYRPELDEHVLSTRLNGIVPTTNEADIKPATMVSSSDDGLEEMVGKMETYSKKKRGPKTKEEKPAAPKAETKAVKASEDLELEDFGNDEAETTAAPEITRDEAMAAFKKLFEAKGVAVATGVLKTFEADRFSEIKAYDYGSFVAACKAVM